MSRVRTSPVRSLLLSLILLTIALTLGNVPGPAPIAEAQAASGARLQEILKVGDPAPGFGSGVTISAIGDVPRIAPDGSITFVVAVQGVPGATGVQAIYRVADGGRPELVFRSGDPAPGGETFSRFPGLPQTPRLHQGRLTFAGSEGPAGGPTRDGIWSDRFGAFDLLMREKDRLPGMPADGEVFGFSFFTRGEAVLLNAEYSQGANVPPENEGLWRDRTGSWDLLLINGMQAPGLGAGVVFDADPLSTWGPLFAFRARGDGRVLAQAWVSGSGVTQDNDEALWIERDAGLAVLVREGDPAPLSGTKPGRGGTFGPTFSSPTFGSDGENAIPDINDAGAVVFGAVLRTKEGRLNSLWTTRSGSLELIAKGGLPLSGSAPGSPAPGLPSGATFATFSTSDLNGRGDIAFEGFADEFGDATNLTEGIWLERSGQIALVAAEGRPVPRVTGASFVDLAFDSLEENGALFFSGRFAGPGIDASNNAAEFRVNPDRTVDVFLREGEEAEVAAPSGGSTLRAVATFGFGPGVTADGRRVAHVTFRDGSSGVYVVERAATGGCVPAEPKETSCSDSLDNDCDGLIDLDDPDCRPVCRPSGSSCGRDGDCCSGQCRTRRGSLVCR
jgi:hypothetical protein